MENMNSAVAFALVVIIGIILFALGGAYAVWRQKPSPGDPEQAEEEKKRVIKKIAYDAFEAAFSLFDATSVGTDKVITEAVRITREKILASNLDDINKEFWDEDKIRRAYSWLADLFVEKLPS